MTKQEMEQYKSKEPIASYPMGSYGVVEILDIEYGISDYAIWRFNFGQPDETLHRAKIKCGVNRSYIVAGGIEVRLDECIRKQGGKA